jgi:hypothetical protein
MSRRFVPAFASTPIPHRVPSPARARTRRRKLESASERRRHWPERVYPQRSTMESANLDTHRPGTNRGSVVRVVVQHLGGSQTYLETSNGTSLFIHPTLLDTRRSRLGRAGGDSHSASCRTSFGDNRSHQGMGKLLPSTSCRESGGSDHRLQGLLERIDVDGHICVLHVGPMMRPRRIIDQASVVEPYNVAEVGDMHLCVASRQ